jgi:hypothetical protein
MLYSTLFTNFIHLNVEYFPYYGYDGGISLITVRIGP